MSVAWSSVRVSIASESLLICVFSRDCRILALFSSMSSTSPRVSTVTLSVTLLSSETDTPAMTCNAASEVPLCTSVQPSYASSRRLDSSAVAPSGKP